MREPIKQEPVGRSTGFLSFTYVHNKERTMIYTSCFARWKLIPADLTPVAISAGVPRWYRGRRMPELAPSRELLNNRDADFETEYRRLLKRLRPKRIAKQLGYQTVLLCWEAPGFRCHRRIVADWLEGALDVRVPELGFRRDLLYSFNLSPTKGTPLDEMPWRVCCDHCKKRQPLRFGDTSVKCIACRWKFKVEW